MAATIIVGTNSWVTLAEAETYFEARPQSTGWDSLTTDDQKNQYRIFAFNWLFYDPGFLAPASATQQAVKNGQCEAAEFLITNYAEWAKRDALIASGVKDFQYSKWRETLGEVTKPNIVINYFSSVGFYGGANFFAQLQDIDDNSI